MKIVTNMGYVYRLSEKAYRRVLRQISQDKNIDLDKEGTLLGCIESDVTDLSAEEAKDLLELQRKEVTRKIKSQQRAEYAR
jgi:hypothetical protein